MSEEEWEQEWAEDKHQLWELCTLWHGGQWTAAYRFMSTPSKEHAAAAAREVRGVIERATWKRIDMDALLFLETVENRYPETETNEGV